MFVKPEWFHGSSLSVLPGPRLLQGWAFYALCLLGIVVPTLGLVARNQILPEALIWLLFSTGACWLEFRNLNRQLREQKARRQLLVIDESAAATIQTGHYELETRNPSQRC